MRVTYVAGTWARKRESNWVSPDSLFERYLAERGITRLGEDLKFWSSALGGTFACGNDHLVWQFGGEKLLEYLVQLDYEDRNVIGHSWGGAVVAYAMAGANIKLRTLVTVTTPPGRGLDDVWAAAEQNIDAHLHLYTRGWGDRIGFIARRGRFRRQLQDADLNTRIGGGHSGILSHPKWFWQIDSTIIPWIMAGGAGEPRKASVPHREDGAPQVGWGAGAAVANQVPRRIV